MDRFDMPISVYSPFSELDLLLAEEGRDAPVLPVLPEGGAREPETIDALNAQILAGLVSP